MRTDRIFPIIGLLAALTVSCPPTFAQQDQSQSGESVADAARKAREKKKSAPKPKHVVTEDEIAPRVPEPPPQSATASAAPAAAEATSGAPASTSAEKNDPPNSEAYWRKRFAAQRKRIADAQVELDVLQRETEKASVQYYSDPQKALQEQYSRKEVNDKTEKVEAKKKEIAALKQQLSDLEDELKRAGGDPGWAR
jgi:chromosome segregation ATPase